MNAPGARDERSRGGLLASLRRLGSTLIETLHSRAELLSLELQRERGRVVRLLLLGVIAFFFLLLGALTATMFMVVLFWESQRLVVIGFFALLYLGIAVGLAMYAKREAGAAKRPFADTVEQLKRDREYLGRRNKSAT
jgi:uncharacterized membrane protein YqjE